MKIRDLFKQNRLIILSLIILGLVVYLNAIPNEFVSDDIADIKENPSIEDISRVTEHYFAFLRPLLYYIVNLIFSQTPAAFRMINILFHLTNIILVFLILTKLKNRTIATFTSILFAIHPLLVEPVVWISGGAYVQYTTFILLTFLFYLRAKETKLRKYWIFSYLSFFLAAQSYNVMSVVFLPLIFFYEYLIGNSLKKWKAWIPYLLITLLTFGLVLMTLPEREQTLKNQHYQDAGIDNPLIQIPIAITNYLELFIWPKALTIYHSEIATGVFEYIVRLIITIILLITAAWGLFSKKLKEVSFWVLWFLIALSPTLTPFRLNWVVAERYAYLGSIGIFTLIGILINFLLQKYPKYKEFILVSFSVIVLSLSIRTIIRNMDWSTADNLWLSAAKTSPTSPTNHNNLGDLYGRRKDYQRAIEEFKTAILLKPNYGDAYHNLGNTYAEIGDIQNALDNYQKAVQYNPNLWQSYQNIASIYFAQKKYPESLLAIQEAIKLNPSNPNLVFNLAVIYLNSGEKAKAKELFQKLNQTFPDVAQYKLGIEEASK